MSITILLLHSIHLLSTYYLIVIMLITLHELSQVSLIATLWKRYYYDFIIFKILFIILCWGYIVTFTKILTIYCNWIHPLHHFPLSPLISSHSWNNFNRSHFSIYIHVYTLYAPYSPSYTLSPWFYKVKRANTEKWRNLILTWHGLEKTRAKIRI
jgi:hypothetical protein